MANSKSQEWHSCDRCNKDITDKERWIHEMLKGGYCMDCAEFFTKHFKEGLHPFGQNDK